MANSQAQPDPCGTIAQDQRITPQKAATYISNFWLNQTCERFGNRYGAGNFIPYQLDAPILNLLDEGTFGVCLFPCATHWTKGSDIFMTMKAATACPNLSQVITIEDEDVLEQSNVRVKKFDPIDYSDDTKMLQAIRNIEYDTEFDLPVQLLGKQVREANDRYKSIFDPQEGYVNAGFAFTKGTDLRWVLDQRGENKAIGFYAFLGLDNEIPTDRIRLILIAVDENGAPMLNDNERCLEKSWPPIGSKKYAHLYEE